MSKQLPSNFQAEQALLGCMILDHRMIDQIVGMMPGEAFHGEIGEELYEPMFLDGRHQIIFDALATMGEAREAGLLDLATWLHENGKMETAGGVGYLPELVDAVFAISHAPKLARLVINKWIARKIIRIVQTAAMALLDGKSYEPVLELLEREVLAISQRSAQGDFQRIEQALVDQIDRIRLIRSGKVEQIGLKTGFAELDAMTVGLKPGNMVVLAARPSVGKSAFAANIAANVAIRQGLPVAFQSLEMSKEELIDRLVASESRIPLQSVQDPRFIGSDAMRTIEATAERIRKAPLYIDDASALTMRQIRARARRIKNKHPDLALLVIDYMQFIKPSSKKRNATRNDEVTEISQDIKALAKELQVPILALSQLSRENEKNNGKRTMREPKLSDLRDSGSIEQDADVVLFLHWPDRNLPSLREGIVGKQRNGRTGRFELVFAGEQVRFADLAKDDSGGRREPASTARYTRPVAQTP